MYISISAFYKNEGDHGIGIQIKHSTPGGNVDAVVTAIQAEVQHLRDCKAVPAEVEGHLLDLIEFGQDDVKLTQDDRLLIVSYIAFMEATGFLKPDNFNGVQYVQVMEPPTQH